MSDDYRRIDSDGSYRGKRESSSQNRQKGAQGRSPGQKAAQNQQRSNSQQKSAQQRNGSQQKSAQQRNNSQQRSAQQRNGSQQKSAQQRNGSQPKSAQQRNGSQPKSAQQRSNSQQRNAQQRSNSQRKNTQQRTAQQNNNAMPKTNPPSHSAHTEHKSAVGRYTDDRPNTVSRTSDSASQSGFKVNISEDDYYDIDAAEQEISASRKSNSLAAQKRRSAAVSEKALAVHTSNPTTATRVVTSSMGDEYQIQDDSVIAPKQIRNRQKSVRKKNRGCIVALVYSAAVCSISILLSYYLIVGINDMFGLVKDSTEIVIDVPKDATLDDITELLDENDVVDYPFFFKMYAKVSKKSTGFKAGTFTLDSKSDYSQLLQKLRRPAGADKSTITVTIPEGYTVEQVAELMEENCVCEASAFLDTINNKEFTQGFLKNVDTKNPNRPYKLEGFLFPDTYQFYLNEGSVNAVNRLLNEFDKKWTKEYTEQAKKIKMSMDDVITLASIVEREASKPEDRMLVASVFYNRLHNSKGTGGKLQSDATRWYPYATKDALMASDKLTDEEKKNWVEKNTGVCDTYRIKGLPDSPVCTPSINSIESVLYHDNTSYYYFCSDANGNFYFAKTLNEHNANLKKAGLA